MVWLARSNRQGIVIRGRACRSAGRVALLREKTDGKRLARTGESPLWESMGKGGLVPKPNQPSHTDAKSKRDKGEKDRRGVFPQRANRPIATLRLKEEGYLPYPNRQFQSSPEAFFSLWRLVLAFDVVFHFDSHSDVW